jgi:uncharacterized protein YndB with AHSA1/START domain
VPQPSEEQAIRCAVSVPVSVERAFAGFIELARWWPREYTWSGGVLEDLGIEPGEGGHCFELGPHGFRCDWGTVLVWEPPGRLVLAWQIAPDRAPEPNPARASEVEVRFVPQGPPGTRVELEHRGLSRHGADGDAYREALGSPDGWPLMLDRYAAALTT